jgi:hypothetical protein
MAPHPACGHLLPIGCGEGECGRRGGVPFWGEKNFHFLMASDGFGWLRLGSDVPIADCRLQVAEWRMQNAKGNFLMRGKPRKGAAKGTRDTERRKSLAAHGEIFLCAKWCEMVIFGDNSREEMGGS